MKTYFIWFLTCVWLFVAQNSLLAQEEYSDSLKYTLGLNLSGSISSGLLERVTVNTNGKLVLTRNRWEFSEDLSYQYNNTNGLQLLDNWHHVAILKYHPGGRWNWFPVAIHLFENNLIYQVKNRNRFGLGIGAYPIDNKGYQVRFTTGYFYERESYDGDVFVNSDFTNTLRKNNSAWLHLSTQIPIADRGTFILSFWYFQSFKERNDYALSVLPKLQMKINKHFSFTIRYDWRFENVYLESLVDRNGFLLFGLNVQFWN